MFYHVFGEQAAARVPARWSRRRCAAAIGAHRFHAFFYVPPLVPLRRRYLAVQGSKALVFAWAVSGLFVCCSVAISLHGIHMCVGNPPVHHQPATRQPATRPARRVLSFRRGVSCPPGALPPALPSPTLAPRPPRARASRHITFYVSPLQKYYVRIIAIVIIYSIESWLALRFIE